ncbi:MAG TPA: acetyl-CoA C-acetyltransferase [Acidimicrobiales bacterium]|nr:acetyl-CoA C-acetyltransferase [Acidimicrobiales bacterium]
MTEAYIVDAVRTPTGKKGGGLAHVHPADLGAHVMAAVLDRTGVDPAAVDDVVFGTVDMLGPNAANVTRTAWLTAGFPESVPATTVDRQCGSSQQAVHFAAQAVMSGSMDVVVAGGLQNMSLIPFGHSSFAAEPFGIPDPWTTSPGFTARFGKHTANQFRSADDIARQWGISREDMERFSLRSHQRAVQAIDEGRFDNEVVAFEGVTVDEGPRRDSTLEKMATLKPVVEGTGITAAVSSQMSDAASAVLVVSEQGLADHGLTPRARVHHMTVAGADYRLMLTGPLAATERALARTGMSIDDFDLFEVNEAFASVPLAWLKATGADPDRLNVNGGAIALGHPIGATGAKLMATMLNELERTGGRYGLETVCENGGLANLTIIERL